jgi:non-ribosomal peptide synthetase component F
MFNMANAPRRPSDMEGTNVTPFAIERSAAQFDLTYSLGVADVSWLTTSYNTDLFDASTIDRMVNSYFTLLEGIIASPDQGIDALPIMSSAARDELIETRNATQADFPREAVTALITAQAARTPDAVAIESGDAKISYAELDARANRLAHYLRDRGVNPGALVGVSLNRSIDMIVSLLAVLKAGAAYVPIDPTYPPHRVQFMLTDSGATAVLTERAAR